MWALAYIAAYHALVAGGLVGSHYARHAAVSPLHASLALFSAINCWIALCEVVLCARAAKVARDYRASEAKLGVGRLPPIFLFQHVSLSQLVSLDYWSTMWSTYCVLDPSYADRKSFGFCVDVGNGFSTFIPTIIFALGMTWPILSARVLGMLGLVLHYQVGS